MGFLKKLFGSGSKSRAGGPSAEGFFLYAQCDHCDKVVRLRITRQFDLNQTDNGYVWHKTIVDNKCFRPMTAVVHFDSDYRMVSGEIEGGKFVTEAEYQLE